MGIDEGMQKSVSKICMFVAKAICLGCKFVMDDKKEEVVYLGRSDMKEKCADKDVNLLQEYKNITASSFTHLNSPKHKYPKQNDGYNCGVFVLWYHLLHLKENCFIVKESPVTLGVSDINLTSI